MLVNHSFSDRLLDARKHEILKQIKDNEDEEEEVQNETVDESMESLFEELIGLQCCVPYTIPGCSVRTHNAVIAEILCDSDDQFDANDLQNLQVSVMFCNPMIDQMRPCKFFLDGHCQFEATKCRYCRKFSNKSGKKTAAFENLKLCEIFL